MDAEQLKRELKTLEQGTLVELLVGPNSVTYGLPDVCRWNAEPLYVSGYFRGVIPTQKKDVYAVDLSPYKDQTGGFCNSERPILSDSILEMRVLPNSTPKPVQHSS